MSRRYIVANLLAAWILAACGGGSSGSSTPPPPPPATTVLGQFDAVWGDFDANYSFFELKGIDWNDSRDRFRSQLTDSSSDTELFNVLSAMLLELEDPHVTLDTPLGNTVYTGWFDQYPDNYDETVVTATYLGNGAMQSPQAGITYGNIDADVGYLHIGSLGGTGFGADIDLILGQLAGVDALIVDLRNNGGGNDQNGEEVAARFADMSRLYRRVRFREGPNHGDFGPFIDSFIAPGGSESFQGPVAVLTNRRVVSSAEALVLAFDVLPEAVSFGDFTGGGSANPIQRSLSNGWQYTVSRWIEYRPDGSTFEGVGIEPDVRVDISAADAAALQDTIIDAAVADLQTRSGVGPQQDIE